MLKVGGNGFGGVYAPATSRQRTSINPVSSLLAQYAAINGGGGQQQPNLLGGATPQLQQLQLPQAAAASTMVQQQQQHPTQDLSALLVNNDLLIQQLRQAQGAAGAMGQQQSPQDLSALFVNDNLLTQQLRQAQGLQGAASAQNNQISFPGVAQGVATGVQPSLGNMFQLPQFQQGRVQAQPQANLPTAATGLLANLMQQQQQQQHPNATANATGSANEMSPQELCKFTLVVHMMCQCV